MNKVALLSDLPSKEEHKIEPAEEDGKDPKVPCVTTRGSPRWDFILRQEEEGEDK